MVISVANLEAESINYGNTDNLVYIASSQIAICFGDFWSIYRKLTPNRFLLMYRNVLLNTSASKHSNEFVESEQFICWFILSFSFLCITSIFWYCDKVYAIVYRPSITSFKLRSMASKKEFTFLSLMVSWARDLPRCSYKNIRPFTTL